jgi:RHS repeat-associated protein
VDGHGTYSFSYEYNGNGQLSKDTYPGGLEESYLYDNYGFKSQSAIGDKVIYKVESTDGLVSNTSFMGKLTTTLTRDARGYESNRRITHGLSMLENFDESYDGATDNLLSRKRNNEPLEYFGYDNMNRLVSVKKGDDETMRVSYAPNGNILFKTGVGNFSYDRNVRPHAVTEVENADGKIPGEALTTSFNDFGKIELIDDAGKNLRMDIAYGPGQQRWYSELSKNGTDIRTTVYAGEYEKVTENGKSREFYYLDGNTIAVRENGTVKTYLAFTDNLGSILSAMDENGAKVFDASYDAWGRQTVTLNSIGLHRGYTGHEMLNEFDIINMNGRSYDPVLGRFFSPDNYVQMPDNSQNFNRYSYCLNNPLKYSDPSGEFAWSIPVIAGAMIGAYAGASIQSGTAAFWKLNSNAWKGAITGGIVGATIGYGVSAALSPSGGVTGLTTTIKGTEVVTRSAGITSSILNSGSINIVYNAITGGDWDNAWKAGIAGLVTGAWAITGGFGMTKCFKTTSNIAKLAKKLGYQMIGTVGQSVGDNWAKGRGLFSKITLGVGPVNLTIGKGQRLLQWENNLGNIAINAFGLVNTVAGGKVHFNTDNLTFEYTGGLMDVFQPYPEYSAGFSPHTVTGNSGLSDVLPHELHHLWQSRTLNDLFLLNYGLQGLNALLLKGNFVDERNYYEDFVNHYPWWDTHPGWK